MAGNAVTETGTRIAFILIGVFAAVLAFGQINPVVNLLARIPREGLGAADICTIVAAFVVPLLLLVCSYVLIHYSPFFAARLLRTSDPNVPYWEQAAYRLGSTFCGVLVISWALPKAVAIASNIATMSLRTLPEGLIGDMPRMTWIMLVDFTIETMIGVYLVVGAPHLVKWLVRRIPRTGGSEGQGPQGVERRTEEDK